MKKILAITLTLLMAFTVAVFSASAADTDVAAIGEAKYESLAAAIADADAGDTITLLSDVTGDVTINKNLTLDGAGKQFTGKITLSKVVATIKNFKFINSQIFKAKESGSKLAEVTVENCSFEGKIADSQYAINVGYAKTLTVKDCTAKNVGFGFVYVPSEVDDVTVKNVNVDGASYGIHIVYNTTTTIENVTIKNAYVGVMDQTYGSKTITFKDCKVAADFPVAIWERDEKIQNFIFEGTNDFGTDDLTFGSSLVKAPIKAEIGETGYFTLQTAINACVAGDNTIKLLADCDENVTITQTEGVNIVLDGNDKKYSGTIKIDGNHRLDGAETLTIKNVNFENTTATTYAYFINAEKNAKGKNSEVHNLTVDSCTFKGTNWQYAIATITPNNLVVKNCTAENVYYLLYNPQGGEKITVEDCIVTASNYGIGSQKCKNTYIKNYTFNGYYTGIYGRSSSNDSTLTMENIDITSSHGNAITLWANNDKTTSKTFKFIFKGDIKITAPESLTWFASQSATNSPYVFGAKCGVDTTGNTFKYAHTPGALSCMAPQTCTVCGEELAPATYHTFGDYVSDDNATCTADGTKTAVCIYGCGLAKITVTDEGSIKPHTPGDAATCMAAQTCTECGTELDAIKDHELGEYVSDNNATCKKDGTKTAECIYNCGLTDTVTDKGSAFGHNDLDADGRCDSCDSKFCDSCGKVHEDWMSLLFCFIFDFFKLVVSFFSSIG